MTSPAEIAVELGRPTPTTTVEYAQWSLWITDAEMLIVNRLGDLNALDSDTVAYVVRKAVAAHVKRPDDATQVDISVDDGRVSRRYASGKGEVTITDAWWRLLDPDLGDSGAFSVRPYGQPDTVCWPV